MTPPLFVATPVSRNGPALKRVNPDALAYVKAAGVGFADIYTDGLVRVRSLAPELLTVPIGQDRNDAGIRREINSDAKAFVAATGLQFGDVYPDSPSGLAAGDEVAVEYASLAGQQKIKPVEKQSRWHWFGAVVGFVGGALAGGPVGAAAGAALVGAAGWWHWRAGPHRNGVTV
jgi:hypothetical protein